MSSGAQRLYRGETTIDFYGRRKYGFIVSGVVLLVMFASLIFQGLNLGIDFKGGVSFEVPVSKTLTTEKAREVLDSAGIDGDTAKVQILTSSEGERIRIQVGTLESNVLSDVQQSLAKEAAVEIDDVSVANVSSSWGRNLTEQAVIALLVFFGFVSLFISIRFETRMAASAFASVIHDVGISVGVYSLLRLEVTPATVVAFLTILGYSLYDTIVVYDKVQDNVVGFSGSRVSYGNILNVSMNQVFMRSLNTSISSVLPVLSLLVVGSLIMGATALQEFAIALLVGLLTGAYSSIFIAVPILGILKERTPEFLGMRGELSLKGEMAHLMNVGAPVSRRAKRSTDGQAEPVGATTPVEAILSHPPRPRKKTRR
jgi:preprotein translocase subunit SecF